MGLQRFIPKPALPLYLQLRSRYVSAKLGRSNSNVFSAIYHQKAWGNSQDESPFYSGAGSYDPAVDQYVGFIKQFIQTHDVRSILEIGCGDFSVGSRYAGEVETYTGLDVVKTLVEFNASKFGNEKISFINADISKYKPVRADLCVIRQVFQHLPNRDIVNALKNVGVCKYVLVTEHLPAPAALTRKNIDKPAGPDTRVSFGSGVYLEAAPFDAKVTISLETPIADFDVNADEFLRTVLIVNG
jgi:SAM-dependent methyltransferase